MTMHTMASLAEKMQQIDFAMLSTHTEDGQIGARPMSNNQDVAYGGDSYYFTTEDTLMVKDIERDPRVNLSFHGKGSEGNGSQLFIAVEGRADLIRDQHEFREHWTPDLEQWFVQGADTPGLVMIRVHAERAHYWDGADEGELEL
ncbi:general stress protein 26 [Sphingobium sp. OAS761]|uniref:pyridoxamine 5'-phosphate oxidase family protein n=1 Tax=Sphingobium sp. OAS761 TaxID=2817901 RepID=UPI0020A06D8F|nr:pyridoxamine 5'-phosphate oxidase family protein [Sphingobium sp. OAS761]MCP1468902.1 general stress protein 26 [Sphingobium sp. OAS761]